VINVQRLRKGEKVRFTCVYVYFYYMRVIIEIMQIKVLWVKFACNQS